jgi:hypothetical protein
MSLTISGILDHKEQWMEWLDLRDFMTNQQISSSHMMIYCYPFKNESLNIGGSVVIFIDVHFCDINEDYTIDYAIASEVNGMCKVWEHVPFGQELQLIAMFKIICNEVINGLGTIY